MAESTKPVRSGEIPPSFLFRLSWADDAMRQVIVSRMREERRQTMNLRLMPTARLLHLQRDEDGATVGWGGVDADHNPAHPEIFSLFVVPDYRTYLLGLLLEQVRYSYLRTRGLKWAYVRMEASTNFSLLRYRVTKGLYVHADREELPAEYLQMCERCELYGNDCKDQAYFRVDVENFLQHADARLGTFDVGTLPRKFELRPEMFRQESRRKPEAELADGKAYRPYWL